jgi:hypothetical protein
LPEGFDCTPFFCSFGFSFSFNTIMHQRAVCLSCEAPTARRRHTAAHGGGCCAQTRPSRSHEPLSPPAPA